MKHVVLAATAAFVSFVGVSSADAAITINIFNGGPGVVAEASGTLDLTGATNLGTFTFSPYVFGSRAAVTFGLAGSVTAYGSFSTVPTDFGAGGLVGPSATVGDTFGITNSLGGGGTPGVGVDANFVSGGSISSTNVWNGQTIATLGLTAGTYVYTLPNDTVTINIAAAPEPASWAMMIVGFGAIGAAMRRRQRAVVRFA